MAYVISDSCIACGSCISEWVTSTLSIPNSAQSVVLVPTPAPMRLSALQNNYLVKLDKRRLGLSWPLFCWVLRLY